MNLRKGYDVVKERAGRMLGSIRRAGHRSMECTDRLPYAYPCANLLDKLFSNKLVQNALRKFSNQRCAVLVQQLRRSESRVNERNFPKLYAILNTCCRVLQVECLPEVYISSHLKGINALSLGTDKAPILLISPKAIVLLDEDELKFMIGHELGHILQKNLMCHTIKGMLDRLKRRNEVFGVAVADLIEVPLNEWYQCAEYTADRAGYLCCRNMDAVRSLFRKIYERRTRSDYHDWLELYRDHPYLKTREEILNTYIQTLQQ